MEMSEEMRGGPVSGEPSPPLIPGRCAEHQYDVVPPKCGACKDARIADELARNTRRPLTLVTAMKRCIVHDLSFENICNGCESDRKASKSA